MASRFIQTEHGSKHVFKTLSAYFLNPATQIEIHLCKSLRAGLHDVKAVTVSSICIHVETVWMFLTAEFSFSANTKLKYSYSLYFRIIDAISFVSFNRPTLQTSLTAEMNGLWWQHWKSYETIWIFWVCSSFIKLCGSWKKGDPGHLQKGDI